MLLTLIGQPPTGSKSGSPWLAERPIDPSVGLRGDTAAIDFRGIAIQALWDANFTVRDGAGTRGRCQHLASMVKLRSLELCVANEFSL